MVRLFNGPLDSVPWRNGHGTVVGFKTLGTPWSGIKIFFFNGFFHWNLGDLIFFPEFKWFFDGFERMKRT